VFSFLNVLNLYSAGFDFSEASVERSSHSGVTLAGVRQSGSDKYISAEFSWSGDCLMLDDFRGGMTRESMVGSWRLMYSWEGAAPRFDIIEIKKDGTFSTTFESGVWAFDPIKEKFTYLNRKGVMYKATASHRGTEFRGTMEDLDWNKGEFRIYYKGEF
tara:strand:- start:4504 stop:4980 length:477 start_codon:yes stop_codon:yes gene_type:complete